MLDLIFETNNLLLVTVGFFLSISAIMVIFSSNPVHAVFFLILVVLCLSSIFIGLGIEFLGVVLIVVYVGAIAVLFLFVIIFFTIFPKRFSFFRRSATVDSKWTFSLSIFK